MFNLQYKPIDEIPDHSARRGPRDSECLRAYLAAKESDSGIIVVTGEHAEVERFYKAMVQWRNRHKETPVNVRKDGDNIYIWVERGEPGE
ncbi:MAG: hypothetical protein HY875_10500 [Chloroflexi bacterium]|nr:hypothetical protein [Chloroflexota bacterium]